MNSSAWRQSPAFIGLFLLVGCSDREKADRDLALVPHGQASQPAKIERASTPSDSMCVGLWPVPVRLSGIVKEEHKLGPPGYGETPKRDAKITIYVLQLPQAITVCADTSAADPRPSVTDVKALQLTGKVDPSQLKQHVGRHLTVYGTLHRQTWGTDFTDVLVRIDSVPEFRRRGASRA